MTLLWVCGCGTRNWLHYEHCTECGREKPAPTLESAPADKPVTELDLEPAPAPTRAYP